MRRLTLITLGLLLLPASPSLALAAENQYLQLTWSELAPLIVGHEVSLVLPDSTHIQGGVLAVSAEALKLNIEKTSNGKAHPKGQLNVPRSAVSEIEVQTKGKWGRPIGIGVGIFGGAALGALIGNAVDPTDGAGYGVGGLLGLVGGPVFGYFIGRHFDHRTTHIQIIPEAPPANSQPAPAPSGNEVTDFQGSAMAADVGR